MVREIIVDTILPALVSLLAAYAVYGIQQLATKVKAQTQQIRSEEQRVLLDSAIGDVEYLAAKTVGAIEQTTASLLRELIYSGKASREDLLALGQQAVDDIVGDICPETQALIEKHFGNFRDYVVNVVEDQVRRLKASEQGGT